MEEVDSCNLGLEHFYRAIGHIYSEGGQLPFKEDIQLIPKQIAQLLFDGHSVELLNGDDNEEPVPVTWLSAIWMHVHKLRPSLRIFVVSVIGLQSSGKSTLLNSLFACRFAVSVGRCSRGLFMKLLFLDEALPEARNFDAILLIDSEGLGSPERMNDSEAIKRDRRMATLAMGISNLTIINVLGESLTELSEIFQIAIIIMARLEQANIKPDILMVQHLQTEKNPEKTSFAEKQFCEALEKAVDLADKQDVRLGIRNAKCLELLYNRVQNSTLVEHFHPYKDGATVNSPPSEGYHDSVVRLYKKILQRGHRVKKRRGARHMA
jgi:hypothetical protein